MRPTPACLEEAAKIAVGTAKNFTEEHPGELDIIKWVLFDNNTYQVYKSELECQNSSELG